jgi:uncharacterized repeat protein (TIGR02543 family)
MKNIRLIALAGILCGAIACTKGGSENPENPPVEGKSYTVGFDAAGGTPAPTAQSVEEGKAATAPATVPTKNGYEFTFWYLSGADDAYLFSTPVTSDITLLAGWQKNEVVIPPIDDDEEEEDEADVLKDYDLYVISIEAPSGKTLEYLYSSSMLHGRILFSDLTLMLPAPFNTMLPPFDDSESKLFAYLPEGVTVTPEQETSLDWANLPSVIDQVMAGGEMSVSVFDNGGFVEVPKSTAIINSYQTVLAHTSVFTVTGTSFAYVDGVLTPISESVTYQINVKMKSLSIKLE